MTGVDPNGLSAAFEAFEATGISADHFGITAAIRAYLAAALTPLKGAPVAEGYALVPIRPTIAMLKAAGEERSRIRRDHEDSAIGGDYWRVMVQAALASHEEKRSLTSETSPSVTEALQKLANEVGGLIAFEPEVRQAIGNTNWNVLQLRLAEADTLLSGPASQPLPETEEKRWPHEFVGRCTLPATKGVTEATAAILNILNTEALVFPLDAKAKRLAERLALAAIASLSLPAPGEGETAEIARLKHECKCLAEAIANAAKRADIYNGQIPLTGPHLLLLADDLATVALSPTAPDLGAVKDGWVQVPKPEFDALYREADSLARCNDYDMRLSFMIAKHKFDAVMAGKASALTTQLDQPQTDEMQPDTYTGGDFNGVVRGKRP